MKIRPSKNAVRIDTEELLSEMSEDELAYLVSEVLQIVHRLEGGMARFRSIVNNPAWDQP